MSSAFPNPEFPTLRSQPLSAPLSTSASIHELTIEIGEMPIRVRTVSPDFARMIEDRYGEFITTCSARAATELEIDLVEDPPPRTRDSQASEDEDVCVRRAAGRWSIARGGFRAEWDPQCRRGWVRQRADPYAIDSLLRILHSLMLVPAGGFLVHAASAVRHGRAYVFAGLSGAGKTTLARLAPPDVTLLTDEISYVKQVSGVRCEVSGTDSQGRSIQTSEVSYPTRFRAESVHPEDSLTPDTWHLTPTFEAFGTPFAGELARIGQKVRAPLQTLFLLKQGPENRIETVSRSDAARELLRHVLFFARDEELVATIFDNVCDFVQHIPVRRLVFTPDVRVWELIG